MITKQELAKQMEQSVQWLIEQDCGCCTIQLDETLAVCVGWSAGYDSSDSSCIHSKSQPTFCINAGIKVWTSDDMRTDFDWIASPFFDSGDVWDTNVSISPNEDYNSLSDYFFLSYNEMSLYEIDDDGLVVSSEKISA